MAKLASTLLTLIGVSFVVYAAITYLPGSRAQMLMGEAVGESAYQRMAAPHVGYLEWLWRTVHLDFGVSSFGSQDVSSLIAGRIGASLLLSLLSLALALVISYAVVRLALQHRNPFTSALYETLSLTSLSLPSFILSLALVLVFSVGLGLLPSGGYVRFHDNPVGCLASLAMPAISLGFAHSGLFMRMMHSSFERELSRPYVMLARAKGLSEGRVFALHAGVNILDEMTTLCAQSLVTIFSSSAAVEYIYSIPGLGALTVTAIARRDMPTLAALVMLASFSSIVLSTACDIAMDARHRRVGT